MGGDSGSCLHRPEHLPTSQPRAEGMLGHPGACLAQSCSELLRAETSPPVQHPQPLERTLSTTPRCPGWEGRLFLAEFVQGKQSKRRAVKGSAEVPSLQIFPVSSHPCFPHRGPQHGPQVVCLIWLEFPPPPTWHSPHSHEHSRPGVLTSTPSAGLGHLATCLSGAPGRRSWKPCCKPQVGRSK